MNGSNGYNNSCRKDIPYPSVSQESVPSLIDNLTKSLYGTITKSVVNRRVVWNVPCDPNQSATVFGIPRNPGEGLMCYFLRALQASSIVGATGFKGATGIQGATGLTGATGLGATGFTGATGATGQTGLQGATGLSGATGVIGATGATGQTGLQGATGLSGATGTTGATGLSGATGAGSTGAQGATGLGGVQGATGLFGATGATGLQGATGVGATGLQGATGISGATGLVGATGVGDTGLQGATGPQGATGLTGATGLGATGFIGATGANGQSASFFNYQANTSTQTLPPSGPITNGHILWDNATQRLSANIAFSHIDGNGNDIDVFFPLYKNGDTFVIQDQNNSDNYQSWKINGTPTIGSNSYIVIPVTLQASGGTGTTNFPNNHQLIWAVVTSGQQGATGLSGATGLTGATGGTGLSGSTGLSGATGPTGPTGAQGATGGTGLSGSTGLSGATGPQGATGVGEIGATGAQGATGAAGATGTIISFPITIAQGGTSSTSAPAALTALGAAPITPATSAQSSSFTLALADANSTISVTASAAANVTVPLNSVVPFPIGTQIIVRQQGTGQLTFVPTGGVTFEANALAYTSSARYANVTLVKTNTDSWALGGDLTPNALTISQGGTGASDAGTARLNLGIPTHYATVRASATQTPIALAGPYSASVTTGTTGVTLTTGDTSLLAIGMTFGTTGLLVCAIASITNSTQFVLSANASATLTAAAIVVYNTSNTTFTYPVGVQAALEGITVGVGDIVFFSAQTPTPTMGAWQCQTVGTASVSQVMVRPTWFTGTVQPQINIIARGTSSQSLGYTIYPTTAAVTDITVGQTPISTNNNLIKGAPAGTTTNTFTGTQTLATNSTTVHPLRFGTGVSQPLLTTALASAVEYDGTYAYLTPATTVARRGLADGAIFHITVLQTAAMTVATPTATTLTYAVGVQTAIDGHTLALYDTVLLTAQAAPAQNGPWIVTTVGTASVAAIWTRPGWFQGSTVRGNMTFAITRGTVGQGTIRYLFPATLGDTDITNGTTALTTATNGIFLGAVPATATTAGVFGQMATDGTNLYVCSATNIWKRVLLTTF